MPADAILINPRVAWPNGKGIRDDDRRIEQARLVEPMTTRHLTTPVEAEVPGIASLVKEVGAGEDGGDARVNYVGALIGGALDGEGMDEDAGNVGEGVERSGRVTSDLKGGEEFADSHPFWRSYGVGSGEHFCLILQRTLFSSSELLSSQESGSSSLYLIITMDEMRI